MKTADELRQEARRLLREADALEAYGRAKAKRDVNLEEILRGFAAQHDEFLKRQG
jgi:hypothetical protein